MTREKFVISFIKNMEKDYGLSINFSFNMPKGFETAFGLYDVTKNVLYINNSDKISFVRFIFTLYHEFRHLMQYNLPELFDDKITSSINYVAHYDGGCYKLKNNEWVECKIKDKKFDFVDIYKSLPYEVDANDFAFEQTKKHLNEEQCHELENIYIKTKPINYIKDSILLALFKDIDKLIN